VFARLALRIALAVTETIIDTVQESRKRKQHKRCFKLAELKSRDRVIVLALAEANYGNKILIRDK
jgi:hypothetical protein